jgi:hypothetical protein
LLGARASAQTPESAAEQPPEADAGAPVGTAAPEPAPAPTAAPAPAPAPAPVPAPAPPAAAPAPATPAPAAADTAWVRISSNYAGTALELRELAMDDWLAACEAPCDRRVRVEGLQARLTAPGMTPSNAFRIDPGDGIARLRVSGGSDSSRTLGLTAFTLGIPVSLGGMALFGYGKVQEESALVTAGIVTLAVGGVLVLGSLPFLSAGGTSVRDGKGKLIASRKPEYAF